MSLFKKLLCTSIVGGVLASLSAGASATLLGVSPGLPVMSYDDGTTSYVAGTQTFQVDGVPVSVDFPPSRLVSDATGLLSKSVSVNILVDNTGALVGGVPGDDLVVVGAVDTTGDSGLDADGVLLTGEVAAFGFLDDGSTDRFDFLFVVTGGALAPFYAGQDIAMTTASAASSFTGDFAVDFGGGAMGNIGPNSVARVSESATMGLFGIGLAALCTVSLRRKWRPGVVRV